jgi:ferritin-like metal-binding protein YciE
MPIKDPKEVFVMMLSDVRRGADHATKLFRELSDLAQDEEIKEALLARVFIAEDITKKLDECFRIIGAQPMKLEGKLKEVFAEDLRREVAEIQSPEARRLYVLAKTIHLLHFRIGEYAALTAAADITGHPAVGVLLESCLAEKLALVERTKRLLRERLAKKLLAA